MLIIHKINPLVPLDVTNNHLTVFSRLHFDQASDPVITRISPDLTKFEVRQVEQALNKTYSQATLRFQLIGTQLVGCSYIP